MLNHEQELRFCKARRGAIAREFPRLNPEQQKAALATEGPLLLLAGAGSGKTTVLVTRLGYMLCCKGVRPEQVLTVTYTVAVSSVRPESYEVVRRFVDKAAGEKDRLMTGTQLLDGYVVDCVAVPHITYVTTDDNEIKVVPSSGEDTRLDLTFTIEAVVTNTITNAVGSQEVRVGNSQYVKTAHFDFYGSIVDATWSYE